MLFCKRTLLSIVALVATSACAPLPTATTPSSRELVGRYADAKNRHDASKLDALYPDDYIEHSGRNPSGRTALAENWKQQFASIPDLTITVDDLVASGDKVVARTTYSGTYTVAFLPGLPANGRRFQFGTIDIWRVEDGRFVEHWDQVDFAGLQRQLSAKTPSP